MHTDNTALLQHLVASLKDSKKDDGAILLVGAGISVTAGIPPAYELMKIAINSFPDYFTKQEINSCENSDFQDLKYNEIMTKLSNTKRKELFRWYIEGNKEKGIRKAKLNFAHLAIAELFKHGYFKRILTVNFDPLLIHACYMVGMYPLPAIYDVGAIGKINAELLHDPSIVYLNGQHVGFVQRNTTDQLQAHTETLRQIVRSTGCTKTWIIAGYSGENDPLMTALEELRPYNNWLYWLEYNKQLSQAKSHQFLEKDEECKIITECDADETFMYLADQLDCKLDFIQQPHCQLELFEKSINFSTAGKKQDEFIKNIKNHKKILKGSELIKRVNNIPNPNTAMIVEGLITHLKDLLQQNDHHMAVNEVFEIIKIIDNSLKEYQLLLDTRLPPMYVAFLEKLILAIEEDVSSFTSHINRNLILQYIRIGRLQIERANRRSTQHLISKIADIRKQCRKKN